MISTTKLISALYLLFGLFLFHAVPKFDELYSSMYSNWRENDSLLIRAFHIPGYIWLIPFAALSIILYVTHVYIGPKNATIINAIFGIVLFIAAIHAFDWLNIYAHCHEWGCSNGLLPTWNLFK